MLCLPERETRLFECIEGAEETEDGGDIERMEVVGVGAADDAALEDEGGGDAIDGAEVGLGLVEREEMQRWRW
jgi:hypothetical protein